MDPSEKQNAKYKSKNLMGYIQDKVDVGMTKLRSDEGVVLDVAILKATLQDEVVPKEKHVRTLKIGCSASAPRQQVNYVIHGLAKRFEDKPGWIVTLKTLIVFHRLMREVDPSFQDELIRYQERTGAHRMLRLDGFADHTTKDTWDYSAWVRVYSVYLDERLGVFKAMRFDPELEASGAVVPPPTTAHDGHPAPPPPPPQPQQGQQPRESKLKSCPAHELLEFLPMVQKLLGRLIACVPEGAAQTNEIVVQSCIMVLRELRAVYRAVCEGIINLADKFFEMERPDALKALDIYRDNIAINDKLNAGLSAINNVPALRGTVQMPALQSLPADFLTTMEEYVKEAPKVMDPAAPQPRAAAGPTGGLRSSTMLKQGGTTSAAITGTSTAPAAGATGSSAAAGPTGVLKIGPPVADGAAAPAAAQPPPATAPSIDLLGDDFAATTISSPPAAAPANAFDSLPFPGQQPALGMAAPPAPAPPPPFGGAAGGPPPPGSQRQTMEQFGVAFPPGQQQQQQPLGFHDAQPAFGSPPGVPAAGPTGGVASPPGGFNPFSSPTQQPYNAPPPGAYAPPGVGGYGAGSPPYQQPPGLASNPFGAPVAGPTGGMPGQNPFMGPPVAGPTGGYGMAPPPYAGPTGAVNPFGGPTGGPAPPAGAWGMGPPQGAAAWGVNVVPGTAQAKRQADPLNDIGVDLFGKPNTAPVQQSLRDMKTTH